MRSSRAFVTFCSTMFFIMISVIFNYRNHSERMHNIYTNDTVNV